MTKIEFLNTAKPLVVNVNGTPMTATPKRFSTGSVGYNLNGKVQIVLPDGTVGKTQVAGNIVVVGSKDLAEGESIAA